MAGFDIASNMLAQSKQPALSLNNGLRKSPAQIHKWSVLGAASAAGDQAPFYNLLTDVAQGSYNLVAPTPSQSAWSTATMARYIADTVCGLRMIHFTGASTNTLLANGTMNFVRRMPNGDTQTQNIDLSTFVTPNRFDPTILSVPINGEVLDGYTYVRLFTDGAVGRNSYTASFVWGDAYDKRADAPTATPAVVAAPGQ